VIWKIYAWIFLLLNLFSLIFYFDYWYYPTVLLSILLSFGLNLAAFAYSIKKNLLDLRSWKILFWLNAVMIGFNLLYQFIPQFRSLAGPLEVVNTESQINILLGILPSLPALYAAYKLAFALKKNK